MMSGSVFAAHPLITDDTGTQGAGKWQFEIIGEHGYDKEDGVIEKGFEMPTVPFVTYGLTDSIDIVFGLPYTSVRTQEAGVTSAARGITDASIEVKARLYEKDGLSLAVKPGVGLPTGDEEKGLGNGKASYNTFIIATKEAEPWAFHLNLGYVRNEYKLQADGEGSRKDIWHVSLASQMEVVKDLNVVANVGMERNPDRSSQADPSFILGGIVYSIALDLDIDLGVKAGLSRPETDYSVLAGITLRM